MQDLKDRILEVVQGRPVLSAFATITEGGLPWVRYVMAETTEDLDFRFTSFVEARKIGQIRKDPEGHLTCGIEDPSQFHMPYLQVQGLANFRTDREARHEYWSDRLSVLFDGPDDPRYGVVTLRAYRIEYTRVGAAPEVWTRDHAVARAPVGDWHRIHA